MKSDLSNDEFQKLEKTCLLLDILIDCEEYKTFDIELLRLKEISDDLLPTINKVPEKKEEIGKDIEEKVKILITAAKKNGSRDNITLLMLKVNKFHDLHFS